MSHIQYNPPPVVDAFLQSEAFIRGIMGPFGSGKSVGCVMALLKWAQEQEPAEDGIRYTRFVIIRNTNRMLEDTTINTVHEWVPPNTPSSPGAGQWQATRRNFNIRFGDVSSQWMFRALDNADDARNLLSMEVTGAWLNEYREINPRIFTDLVGRVGRYRGPGAMKPTRTGIIMDSNPPAADGFYYDLFEKPPTGEVAELTRQVEKKTGRPMRELFRQPSGLSEQAENVENLPEGYYELMIANNQDKSQEWVNVHVHGEYGYLADGRPVYNGFRSEVHIAPEPLKANPAKPLSIGIDFGLTPAAAVFQQNVHGQWLALGELVAENSGIERFADNLLRFLRQRFPDNREYEVWGDPAGQQRAQTDEKTCFQVLRAAGFTVRPGPQDLETRIGSVQRCIDRMVDGRPGIIYDKSCDMLIKGKLGLYRYRKLKTADGRHDENPEKNEASHVADAEQYILGSYEGPAMQGRAPRKWGGGTKFNEPVKRPTRWKIY